MAEAEPSRRAYKGSCHCKATRFIIYLTLPAPTPAPDMSNVGPGNLRFYRCNCTFCHKAAVMHIRLPSPSSDFQLLSPLDPMNELGDYQCGIKNCHFLFCKTCGVRCFSFSGEGETEDVEGEDGEMRRVWHVKKGSVETHGEKAMYLSVNAHAVDAEQGFDMRALTEGKKLWYLDSLHHEDMRPPTMEKPQVGGSY
ncbi:hypothetical protein CC79DRAFT_452853 [Sarocladium strictum]